MAKIDLFELQNKQNQSLKLLIYRVISPAAILIILILTWYDIYQDNDFSQFDVMIRVFFLVAYLIISILLWVKKDNLLLFEKLFYFSILIGYVSIFYGSIFALYQNRITVNHIAGLFWVPILYFMTYLVFEMRVAFRINLILQGVFFIPSIIYLIFGHVEHFLMAIWSFHLSNICFVLSLGVIMNTMMRYVKGNARAEILEEAANLDFLTRINNRRAFDMVLRDVIRGQTVNSNPFSVVMIDLDHFKHLNDTYGHLAGDQVLKCFAACLKDCIREVDHLGRWGGEEFIILLPETSAATAVQIAERIRTMIHQDSFAGYTITASFGIAEWWIGETPEALVNRADQALYQAKNHGRNRVELYV